MFTWFRGGLRERLDRAVSNAAWLQLYPLAGLSNLDMGKSDHRPVLLDTEYLSGVAESTPKRNRKFEMRWLAEESVNEIVTTAWQKLVHQGLCPTTMDKLNSVHRDLHAWDRRVLKKPHAKLKKARRELEALMREPFSDDVKMRQKELSVLIENLLEQDEIYWAQRGRVNWLKKGDRNSSYFQHSATARRRRNLIKKLKDESQNWVEGNGNLSPLVRDYFRNLFTSSSAEIDHGLLSSIKHVVTNNMNEFLVARIPGGCAQSSFSNR